MLCSTILMVSAAGGLLLAVSLHLRQSAVPFRQGRPEQASGMLGTLHALWPFGAKPAQPHIVDVRQMQGPKYSR